MKAVANIKLIKKRGKLVPETELAKEQYRLFIANLSEGASVNALFELKEDDGTHSQLGKIHIMIKEMANEQGETVAEMKKTVKRECGMAYKENGKEKFESFGKCSKKELSNVIESIIQMGRFLNIEFTNLED